MQSAESSARNAEAMKSSCRFALFSLLSSSVMVVADYFLGPKAEFLNAFTALQRIVRQEPRIAQSLVAREFGETGELLAVIAVNLIIGAIATAVTKPALFESRRERSSRNGSAA